MKVAVGVIFNKNKEILITRRPLEASHGGYWEFPGGKLMQNEEADSALLREIKEEIGIIISDYCFLTEVFHQYDDKLVHLLVYKITAFTGKPQCLEGQLAMRWVSLSELKSLKFPEANHKIISLIDLK
ncbi:8-oxo-dGTP diphosphatase MutT [Legionella israelensis]|uniref:8-oxo-dGTP diphosphatase n=1 Tax=Legionella israelensis TaxID=454 RepID=A0A0W0VN15_9GAMM|nr:8-oxo-dGTP diphosphatase MutT [Legionella israelensis]KTD21466.1 Mutator protein MutT [Legionella israelensis]QBR85348.1 8-oxo-dGTP diphosphatase MutT [Legionella israelensis]QBS08461.1 8-oxo-dGTP diphosphatase MutT [Legionella israelensis]QDP72695.1 8-oxo-dGTP diphosphatase MutT [Legionella israelensis]SCY16161.1 8-oxo-dGTPase [Legionella israelensis DSM 19235]